MTHKEYEWDDEEIKAATEEAIVAKQEATKIVQSKKSQRAFVFDLAQRVNTRRRENHFARDFQLTITPQEGRS